MKKIVLFLALIAFLVLPVKSFASPVGTGFCWGHLILHHHHFVGIGKASFMATGAGVATFFSPVIAAAIWHIPAWEKAKANGTEAAYQAQKMFPQQLFAKLPGGNAPTVVVVDPEPGTTTGAFNVATHSWMTILLFKMAA